MPESTSPQSDSWLIVALATVATLLVGWLIFLHPVQKEVAMLRQRVTNQGEIADRQTQVAAERQVAADLRKNAAALRAKTSGLPAFHRNRALQELSRACAERGIGLHDATSIPNGSMPALLKDAHASGHLHGADPEVWKIELSGSYPAVLGLFDALSQSAPLIVPLRLGMQSDLTGQSPTTWTIFLWI